MRVLFLEDEEAIRGFVRINLKRNGMEVTEAEDGETALELAKSAVPPFDIALLDVMLPTISGFDVCEQLRQLFPRMGIIMLTAKSQEEDKIRGLELGADDYVQKPFSPGELIARLNALKRRMLPYGEEQPGENGAAAVEEGDAGGADLGEGLAAQASAGAAGLAAAAGGGGLGAPAGEGANAASASAGYGAGAPEGGGLAGAAAYGGGNGMPPGAGAGVPAPHAAPANAGQYAGAWPAPGADPAAAAGGAPHIGGAPGVHASAPAGAAYDAATGGIPAAGRHASADPSVGAPVPDAPGSAASPAADPAQPQTAVYRRPTRAGDIASGPFLLSAAERRLWKSNVEIVLTPTEWTLVKLLMEREGEGLSRDDILNAVWGRHYVGDLKIVDVNIRRIRQKIEVKPSDPKHIETLWGYGYRWNRSEAQ